MASKPTGRPSAGKTPPKKAPSGRTAPAKPKSPQKSAAPAKKQSRPAPQKFPSDRQRFRNLLLYLWVSIAFPELVLHLATAKNVGMLISPGLLLAPLFALLPAAVLFVVCTSLVSRGASLAAVLLTGVVWYLLCASQLIYYRIFGTFYTFYSMTNGAAAFQFADTIRTALRANWVTLAVMALPLLWLLLFGLRRCAFHPRRAFPQKAVLLILAVLVQLLTVRALPVAGGQEDTSAYGLYHSTSDSYLSVNKLGLFTALRLDIARSLSGSSTGGTIVLDEPLQPLPQETTAPPQTTPPPETTEPLPTIDTSPNVLSIDFDGLIAEADSAALREMHQYFASRTPSAKNEKTGLFRGCNLILITAEAFSHLAVDPELTPTLYRLTHEGFYFSNYYVPDWGVSTTDGEYAFLTGTVPKSGVWSFKRSAGNAMPLTMNRQLMALGYSSFAYHGHTYTYYDRNKYLTNLGYDYKGLGNGLEVTKQWPESDVEVVDLSTGDYTGSTPFSVYYMSISGHREFNFMGNSMSAKNKSLVEHLPYSEHVRAYLACQLELEQALTLLLERLEEAGVLENTVIALTADHYPNGLTADELGELLGHAPESNFEIYRNGCILYKPGMTPETIDSPVSHLDLLPTLSNLFGLEFDSRLYMGRDVFSDASPLVMFRNRSWITDRAMHNADTGETVFLDGTGSDDAYVRAVSSEVSNRFAVSTRILEQDYWAILFDEN